MYSAQIVLILQTRHASQTVKKLIHCERKGSGNEAFPEFNPQAEFISAEENPVFLRPDKVQGFPQK